LSADAALVDALDARARAVREFAELKRAEPELYLALPRDSEVLARGAESVKEFPAASLPVVLREVLSASAAMIAPVRVSYLAPEGGFAHAAARMHFGAAAEFSAADTVDQLIDEVARKRASFGVLPIETSMDGSLSATLHGLARAEPKICAEVEQSSSYHLMSSTGNASDVEKIYGTPAAIAACERFLRATFPKATVIDVPAMADAASFAREDHGAAVVGTDVTASIPELEIVRQRIEDQSLGVRFAIVGHDLPPRTGHDRTVLALAVHDEPGALHKALRPFADRNINLTRLESRPAQDQAWRYLFFVELDGHVTDRMVLTALEELRAACRFLKVLGSYPRPM
jgi:chorismate mutase/prephenate dehydratase